jgi:hypothetical protein
MREPTASRKKMVIWQGKKNESQQIRVSPNDTARCVAGGSIRLYLRRGSRNRSFSGMAKPPGREMAADDGALTNLRVKQFRTVRSRTEPTRPKTL